ncbi:hypothetical protein GCM10008986_09480 [Salinibacillus aidingensis]|uniref:Spo0E like sporulation regulatory protein n=1 Tax=Salinibacillus aidingensis TaxID=237684 RepID=A0ABN1AXX2_9BACI
MNLNKSISYTDQLRSLVRKADEIKQAYSEQTPTFLSVTNRAYDENLISNLY